MTMSALVTINILSWNRKKCLEQTLYELRKQTYPNIEIIVVDNASTDGTQKMIEKKFPEVKLIKMPKNLGIEGWNWGFVDAKGKYIVVLDDDSYPEKDGIGKMVDVFESDPSVGIICFKIIQPSTGHIFTKNWFPKVTGFCGCGAGIRVEVLKKVGFYPEEFFIYMIERDFAIRVWNAEYFVMYRDDIIAYHKRSSINRSSKREIFFVTRNQLWFLFKYFNIKYISIGSIRVLVAYFIIALNEKALGSWLKGILKVLAGFRKTLTKRQKISHPIQDFYYHRDVLFEPIRLKIHRMLKGISYEESDRYKNSEKYIPRVTMIK